MTTLFTHCRLRSQVRTSIQHACEWDARASGQSVIGRQNYHRAAVRLALAGSSSASDAQTSCCHDHQNHRSHSWEQGFPFAKSCHDAKSCRDKFMQSAVPALWHLIIFLCLLQVEPSYSGQVAKSVGGGRVKTERVGWLLGRWVRLEGEAYCIADHFFILPCINPTHQPTSGSAHARDAVQGGRIFSANRSNTAVEPDEERGAFGWYICKINTSNIFVFYVRWGWHASVKSRAVSYFARG